MLSMRSPERIAKTKRVAENRQQGAIILEDIYDPHNAQAVFRTCDAFGFQNIHLIFEKGTRFDPRAIGKSTSSSANKWVDFHTYDSTEECLEKLKADGYEILATVLADDSEGLFDAKFSNPKTALMLGNEKRGLSEKAVKLADRKIIIPMSGMIQSLNLSVTAAICMYEITRQRHELGMEDFLISSEQQHALHEELLTR